MAEKKLGDVVIGLIALVFFVGAFGTILNVFDDASITSESYGDSIMSIHDNISTVQEEADEELTSKYFSNSSFSLTTGSDIDTRGSSEVAIMAKNSPGTIRNFIDSSIVYMKLHKLVVAGLVMFVFTVVIVLGLRFWRPGGI